MAIFDIAFDLNAQQTVFFLKVLSWRTYDKSDNYTTLVFSSEDKIKTFWTTPNPGSLCKKLCLWVNPPKSGRGTINSINKLPPVFSNASLSGFPPLLSTTLSLFYCCSSKNRMKLILWQEEMHMWVMKLTQPAFIVEQKIIFPFTSLAQTPFGIHWA